MSKDLIILQKTEDMAVYAYQCIEQFPKGYKFTLGERIQIQIEELISIIITCNRRYHKKTTLHELDVRLDTLRIMVRMARTLKILPFNRYEHWAGLNDEIGRLIGGWIRSFEGPPREPVPSTGSPLFTGVAE
jgi:hypothetical protein